MAGMKLTGTNAYVVAREIKAGLGVIGRVAPPDIPHLKRALQLGVLIPGPTQGTWIINAEGAAQLAAKGYPVAPELVLG